MGDLVRHARIKLCIKRAKEQNEGSAADKMALKEAKACVSYKNEHTKRERLKAKFSRLLKYDLAFTTI